EVARGQRAARIEAGGRNHALAVVDSVLTVDGKAVASAEFPGPVRVDGRELPGRLEVFIDRGALVAVNAVDLEQYVAAVVASEVSPKWLAEITAALRKAQRIQAEIRGVAVETRTASGRAKDLALATFSGTRPLSAVELRQLLGYNRIPSLLFEVSTEGATALFRGRGSGH